MPVKFDYYQVICGVCRYKRRLHALWSYLRGTDQAPAVSQLRQKVLKGKLLCCAVLSCAERVYNTAAQGAAVLVAAPRLYTLQSLKCLAQTDTLFASVHHCCPRCSNVLAATPLICNSHLKRAMSMVSSRSQQANHHCKAYLVPETANPLSQPRTCISQAADSIGF